LAQARRGNPMVQKAISTDYPEPIPIVMPGLVPGIPLRKALCLPKRDGRDKPGHDG
jgi:hypothetical protein